MPFVRLWRALLLSIVAVALGVSGAFAQGIGNTGNPLIEQQRGIIQAYSARADELEKQIAAHAEHDGQLVEVRLKLEALARELLASAVAFRPRLAEINARLDQLGPAPPEGQQELDIVAAERAGLIAEKGEINAVLGLAESLSIRVNGMIEKIGTMRSELFRNVLTKRYSLTDAFDSELLKDVSEEYWSFYRAVSSWLRFVVQYKFQSVLAATFFALVAAAVLLVGGRRVFGRLFVTDPPAEDLSYLSRLSVAFWSTLLPTMAVAVFLLATLFFFNYFNVLRGDIGIYLTSLFGVIGIVFCVNRLANAALAPKLPNWRLIAIDSRTAWQLIAIVTAMAVVIGFNSFLAVVNNTMGSPLSLTIARSFLAATIVGVLLILIGLLRDEHGQWRPWRAWLRYTAIGLGVFIILTALLGYIGLATFVSMQVVVTGTVLITAYIGFLSARAIGAEGGFAETSIGRWLAAKSTTDATTLDQIGLIVSLLINLMVLLLFLPLILFMWGFQPGDIQAWAYKLGAGFSIGTFRFSPTGILTGIVVFVIGYFVTRWFQAWLDGSVMARGRLDTGVRNSIRTVVGYAGLALATLIAISSAGIDLSSFALVAGGLSLGIGFGLQNVVSNFVSGLILLAERPFKAGDWIVAGNVSGTVKKISVRATEIETFQRQSVILPNSELINSAVGNWTHRNKLGRVDVKVGVAYGTDVKRVHALLLDIAKNHPLVLKNPEPFVLFANFGPTALEFEVRVFLADVLNGGTVQNDIRFSILETFEGEGIEIPSAPRAEFPKQQDRWPTDDERDEAGLIEERAQEAAAMAERKAARRRGGRPRKPDPG
ncbi:mechanosensitive ion channel family protein [Mesorhizobium sp. KR9-304]|uniref:mechanosensitive ion channel family protein n=1 Tax=Mesorhizobium sp. KR9-304 TaxID=3156614 RepID=UPI0032B486D6